MSTAISVMPARGLSYEPPTLLSSSGPLAEKKEWFIVGLALALAVIWYGSAWAFCWSICHGRVSSCNTGGPFWARTVSAVCHS